MPIIKRNAVRLEERPARRESSAAACAPAQGARLLRTDGVVRAIEVTCSCGDVTVIELEYSAAVPTQQASPDEPAA